MVNSLITLLANTHVEGKLYFNHGMSTSFPSLSSAQRLRNKAFTWGGIFFLEIFSTSWLILQRETKILFTKLFCVSRYFNINMNNNIWYVIMAEIYNNFGKCITLLSVWLKVWINALSYNMYKLSIQQMMLGWCTTYDMLILSLRFVGLANDKYSK